jgi:hypothetical protein
VKAIAHVPTRKAAARAGAFSRAVQLLVRSPHDHRLNDDMLGRLREHLEPGPPSSIRIAIGPGCLLCLATLGFKWRSDLQARVAVASIGIILILIAQLRPASLWNLGKTQDWRFLLGDRGLVLVYTLLGLVMAIGAWFVGIG